MMRGSSAVVIWPNVPLLKTVLGFPNRAWFRTLKASHRRSSFKFSRIGKVLQRAASRFQLPGPVTMFLPAFPYVPAACFWNAEVLNHCRIAGFEGCESPTTLGRSDPTPVSEMSVPSVTFKGAPVAAVKMVDACQLPAIRWTQVELYLGLWTTAERLKSWRRSEAQLAHSARRFAGF